MGVSVEIQNAGDPAWCAEIVAIVEHFLDNRTGSWTVLILGSQASDKWELQIRGPFGFERNYTLEGSVGEHEPETIRALLSKMLPR